MKKNKIFCIGLHKTGTSSLHEFSLKCGYKSTHSANWAFNNQALEKFDFFSDGGSHFDNIIEFDYESLLHKYPDALFILNVRDARSWIVSKLKHAGWKYDTLIEHDDPGTLYHDWKKKTFLHIRSFIEHKYSYEAKVKKYFRNNCPEKLLVIDVTDNKKKEYNIRSLLDFMGLPNDTVVEFPHSNKARQKKRLSDEVMEYIDNVILAIESKK